MKINIWNIVKEHHGTLVDQNSGKPGLDDILIFYAIPILISGLLILVGNFDFYDQREVIKALVGGVAIFVGLLFNALVMLINLFRNIDDSRKVKKEVVEELIANIAYSILIAFSSVVLVLFRFDDFSFCPILGSIFDFVILMMLVSFVLIFLMIIRRTYLVINK